MTNPLTRVELTVTDEELQELKDCDAESVGEYIIDRIDDYVLALEQLNINPEIVMAALLQVYCNVAVDHNQREEFEDQLTFALEEPWETQIIH
jgi:hypothetical protein